MWIPVAVFAGVLAIVLGAYYLLIVRPEEAFVERLTPKAQAKKALRGIIKDEERLSAVGPLHSVLERSSPLTTPLQLLIEQSGLRLNIATFLLFSACLALVGYLFVSVMVAPVLEGIWPTALAVFAAAFLSMVPYAYVRRVRTKRMLKFEEHFPEAIDLIARALRAGHALPTGLSMVAEEMPPPIGTEFRVLYDEQNYGLNLPDALRNFARRVPVLDARFFVTAVLIQRESGGNLAEVLDNLASVIRDRFKVKRQVRVISAHGRITGWVLALLPPSLAVVVFFLSPVHLQTLFGDELGIRMILTAVVLQVIGTLAIRKIVDIEY